MAYTTIDDPSAYFQITLYTGDGSASQAQTNTGNSDLQPDMIWIKKRNDVRHTSVTDSSRGFNKRIQTSVNSAEGTTTNDVISAQSDGFTVGDNGSTGIDGDTYVAWQWKNNGGTTTTNDASATGIGSVDSVYQANTTAGFSIVTWTGTGSAGTIAHGLGATPQVVILKSRDNAHDWFVAHNSMHATPWVKYLRLHADGAVADDVIWNDTAPTSTVFSVGSYDSTNGNTVKFVAYCFKSIQGYSKFGSYTGNGNADGPFVYTGFKPAWIMHKASSAGGQWGILDNTRNTFNVANSHLKADLNNAEVTNTSFNLDLLSNGFKIRATNTYTNGNGVNYVYMAFAENPFVSSEGVPATAR